MKIRIKRFDKTQPLPAPTEGAACFDYFCRESVTIPPHEIRPVAQNVAMETPADHALLMFVRSSTPMRKGLMLANNVGVIDPKYSGDEDEHLAFMFNFTNKPVTVEKGDRIVQGMFVKRTEAIWEEVDQLDPGYGGYKHETKRSR